MNLENSKTSEPHLLMLKLTDKSDLRRWKKYCLIQCQYLLYMEKHKKNHTITMNLKYHLQQVDFGKNVYFSFGSFSLLQH